jgi:hypothetical protein
MTPSTHAVLRVVTALAAAGLLAAGATLGYIAVIPARRSEGVFLPAGYVAIACFVAGGFLLRMALREL